VILAFLFDKGFSTVFILHKPAMETMVFSATQTPVRPPEPLDNGGNGKIPVIRALSFRDKLLRNKRAMQPKERMDLIQQGLVKELETTS
jgi:hypothetical protein